MNFKRSLKVALIALRSSAVVSVAMFAWFAFLPRGAVRSLAISNRVETLLAIGAMHLVAVGLSFSQRVLSRATSAGLGAGAGLGFVGVSALGLLFGVASNKAPGSHWLLAFALVQLAMFASAVIAMVLTLSNAQSQRLQVAIMGVLGIAVGAVYPLIAFQLLLRI